jgi:hypothetical protein
MLLDGASLELPGLVEFFTCELPGLAEFCKCELPELEETGEFPVLTVAGLFPSGLLCRFVFVEGFVFTTEAELGAAATTGAANAGPLVSADILST